MRYLIAGGGKFGTRSLRKLHIAHKRKGYHVESILVVDRDPGCRAAKYIARVPVARLEVSDLMEFGETVWRRRSEWEGATWVPAPIAPHLVSDWIKARVERECGVKMLPVVSPWKQISLPFVRSMNDGRVLLSHAPGICPLSCTEPANCAITGGPRWWEMKDTISGLVASLPRYEAPTHAAVLYGEHHYANDGYGVGGIPMARIYREADAICALAREGAGRIAVATISSCHGVVNLFEIKAVGQIRANGAR